MNFKLKFEAEVFIVKWGVQIDHGWWTLLLRNGVRNDICDWFASTSGASLRRKSATKEQIFQFSNCTG